VYDIKYILKPKSLVTKSEYAQLKYLHFKDGLMWPRYRNYAGSVILAIYKTTIVGWGFVYKHESETKRILYIYVHPDYRRNKIGSNIYNLSLNKYKSIKFFPHDTRSRKFFKSIDKQ
jgi:GNAT superfamily N-acetyltransferase